MSVYSSFKEEVLAYANRSSTLFTTSSTSIDLVLAAMNDAVRAAQRKYAFNLNRRQAFAQLSLSPTSMLTDFDTDPVNGTLCVVKQVDAVYEYASAVVVATTRYYRTAKFPLFRQSFFELELDNSALVLGGSTTTVAYTAATQGTTKQFAYLQGVNVYHSTTTTPTWYLCDVIEWLADHDGGAGTNVFLTYFKDWLKYATLLNLNQYLKDGERFNIDAVMVTELWDSVKQFDAQQGASGQALSGD